MIMNICQIEATLCRHLEATTGRICQRAKFLICSVRRYHSRANWLWPRPLYPSPIDRPVQFPILSHIPQHSDSRSFLVSSFMCWMTLSRITVWLFSDPVRMWLMARSCRHLWFCRPISVKWLPTTRYEVCYIKCVVTSGPLGLPLPHKLIH